MWPASGASPSERSSIAVATRASRFPSSMRSGTGRQRARPERGARSAERPGHDDDVAGPCSRAAGHALRAAERGHGQDDAVGAGRVAAAHRHAALVQAGVELEHVLELGLRRQPERDEQRERVGARGGEVAEVDGGCARAELPPVQQVEAEVDALDEHVLRHDEPARPRAASCSIPCASPRRSSSPSSPNSPSSPRVVTRLRRRRQSRRLRSC